MYKKIALHDRMSRTTVAQLHRYLSDFAQGAHRVFWNGERAFLEIEHDTDLALVRNQFPTMVRAEERCTSGGLPW